MIGKDTGVNEVVVELVLKDLFTKIVDLAEKITKSNLEDLVHL